MFLFKSALCLSATSGEIPNWFAVIMGIGTVFVGLLSIIIICLITGALCGTASSKKNISKPAVKTDDIKDRQKILAAVCAVCAEDMGTDVNSLRVLSFKKVV